MSNASSGVYSGVLIGESLRHDAVLEIDDIRVRRLWRAGAGDPAAGQPLLWTFIEFDVAGDRAIDLAQSLSDVLEGTGGWYCSFGSSEEMVVVFADHVFRYRRGDVSAGERVEAYARSVGVPGAQLDWED